MKKGVLIGIICAACAVIAAVIILIASGVFTGGGHIVGKNIKIDKVNEFYYTYSTSSFPPDYQRYHFYIEDGKYFFYHEKREGEEWPLTEEHITVNGTVQLSENDWQEFFGYLEGGTVEKRGEHLESGSSVSLYLYWQGDRSVYQEFSFAGWDKEKAFVEYCEALASDR